MDEKQKKTALRMIPYGLYVLTGKAPDGQLAAATINWVTQASFSPPLVALGVKVDSGTHAVIKASGKFALNILGKDQAGIAYTFFKPVEAAPGLLSGQPYHDGANGAPVLDAVPAYIECTLIDTVERGDHSVFIGEVTDAVVRQEPAGRPDDATLWLKDLGEKVFYGG
ncbi:flavin reductase family protein [Immundisolibacter sp.]|uniref:flavin reductase family protein n=1 Tax=Immundisolibacter sp. TaxID=1934948 RepID=UPI00262ACDA1|nr:flavin reductase family protein [Immundisolibacter sp.]MDD3651546.1 flavin reductase family protein [Immundisolibacter sp.]